MAILRIATLIQDQIDDRDARVRFLKFCVVGLTGILVNQGILYFLFEFVHLPFYLCSLLAIETSIVTNFLLNDSWTWRNQRAGRFFIRLLKYNTSAAFSSIFISITALLFFKEWLGLPYLIANLAGIGFGMVSNFLVNSFWTYGELRIRLPLAVWLILIISLTCRLLIAGFTGAGFDEAYYYAYSIRPSMSYFDHPPFVGFLAGFFPYISGTANPFTIRLGAVALFTGSGLLFYRFSRTIVDEQSSVLAYGLFNIIPLFFILAGSVIIPDSGLVFFWILALFPLKHILTNEPSIRTWLTAGVLTGLAMLSKYHGIILGFSLFLGLAIYRPKYFLKPGPYLYGVSALITFLPVILWNVQHDFISFTFQGTRAVGSSLTIKNFLLAVGGQAAYLTPMAFIPLLVIMFQTVKKGLVRKQRIQQFYLLFGTVPVLLFLLISFFTPILPHWTLPGYIVLIIPLASMIRFGLEKRKSVRILLNASVVLTVLLMILAFGYIRWGILFREVSAKNDVSLDMIGWEAIPRFLEENEISQEACFLFSHKWFLCGEIELATQEKYPVQCFNSDDPRGYGIWNARSDLIGRDGIYICSDRYFKDPAESYSQFFESVSAPDSVVINRAGIPVKTIYFYRCHKLLKNHPSTFH